MNEEFLKQIVSNAERAALRDGYEQIIYKDKNNEFGFVRKYPNCLCNWNGEIEVCRIILFWENGSLKTKSLYQNN